MKRLYYTDDYLKNSVPNVDAQMVRRARGMEYARQGREMCWFLLGRYEDEVTFSIGGLHRVDGGKIRHHDPSNQ